MNTPTEMTDQIADVLMLLSEVTAGDFSGRLRADDVPEDSVFHALAVGINETVDHLARANEKNASAQRELEMRLATIERQRLAIRELSTPILEVWDGILCLPVVGVLDSARSSDLTEALLDAVVSRGAERVIIDVTGIDAMDTATADNFLRMARAVQLLGSSCVLTGVSPSIAQTIVQMGVDLGDVRIYRTLRNALKESLEPGRQAGRPGPG